MTQYQVNTLLWYSPPLNSLQQAVDVFEKSRESILAEGVNEESFIDLVASEDGFVTTSLLFRLNAFDILEPYNLEHILMRMY